MATKKEQIAQEVARAVGAGKAVAMETVDFSDPNRPKTCLEVDFPILPVNQVAVIEGNAGKPIYQMSKWWARRRSSVFRSMLIAAATKAPEDPSHAAKLVWDNYYANHQKKGAFKHLKVADIFMGGGTTLVEGSRLGMQMSGNDLNPVAWFVVKQELADVDLDEVKRLLADVEAEVKPQIMPFYYCDGPNGEKGTWTHKPSGKVMGADFDPLALKPEERKDYAYDGPEIIYTFWAKHGPCQVTGCGHRTPIMTNPVMAVKTLTVKHWAHKCPSCSERFEIEDAEARMAPDAPLYVAPDEKPYSILNPKGRVICPHCGHTGMVKLDKGKNKKVELTLLVHPEWLAGSPKTAPDGGEFGGAPQDDAASTRAWNSERGSHIRLLEVRGKLPENVTCPDTGATFATGNEAGTTPKRGQFECRACGTLQNLSDSILQSGKSSPVSSYAFQGLSSKRKAGADPYRGRFFGVRDEAKTFQHAEDELQHRSSELESYLPTGNVPEGLETSVRTPLHKYHYNRWSDFYNPRQLLTLSLLNRAIWNTGEFSQETREFVFAAFQQYTRNQNMFCIWNISADKLEPFFSKNNFHPPARPVENSVFSELGRGNWVSCVEGAIETAEWKDQPWELSWSSEDGKSQKVFPKDKPQPAEVRCASSTDLAHYESGSIDLVITDPPFGDIMQYSELSGLFYAWMKPVLENKYPYFSLDNTPTALEAVANEQRHGKESNEFYKKILTACWSEAARVLKPGGVLSFTFHHDRDEPWVAVLESLFDAGFYLEAAYPIRADETKGAGGTPGTFGAQKVEYDIIHVCRKRNDEPKAVSWARMRREVLADTRQLQGLLENHARHGLPEADIQVIRRGKALEYFSQHYGKVYVDEGRPISVKDALVGINQLIDEDANKASEPPPVTAEPITRQFLRIFDGKTELARDQMQKMLRGSGIAPDEFVSRGWAREEKKVFHLNDPLAIAQDWQGRHRRKLSADLDQTFVLMGACYDGSGINAADTLKNENFKPHAALKSLLEWMSKRGQTQQMRNAASRALSIYNNWAASNKEQVQQLSFFLED